MKNISEMENYELYYILRREALVGNDTNPYDMDLVWTEIAKRYKACHENETADKEILASWLRETERYNLMDHLMLTVYSGLIKKEEYIDNTDWFFISNIHQMRDIISERETKIGEKVANAKEYLVSKMDKKDVISYVKEILLEIDPAGEWLEIYTNMLKEGRIIYLSELNEEQTKKFEMLLGMGLPKDAANSCIYVNNNGYVFLTYNGLISDIPLTIHEVVHYISKSKNNFKRENPTLREFYALFFELYTLRYMEKAGFKKEELKAIENETFYNLHQMAWVEKDLMDYLVILVDNGKILEEYDDSSDKYHKCDESVDDLVDNIYVFNDFYPYIIGEFLAEKALEKMENDEYLLSMIKFITDKLPNINPYEVFTLLGCTGMNLVRRDDDLIFQKDVSTKKKTRKIDKYSV